MIEKIRVRLLQQAQSREILHYLESKAFATRESFTSRHGRIGKWVKCENGKRVLELGCGPGRYAAMLAGMGFDIVAVDPYDFDDWKQIQERTNVDFKSGVRAENLPFDDSFFDHVCCYGTLLYLDDPDKSLKEIHRVLKPNGRLALRTVNSENFYTRNTGRRLDPVSKNLYSLSELRHTIEAAGFNVDEAFGFGFWPPIGTNLYWFATTVIFPAKLIDVLDWLTPENNKHNNIVQASKC